MNTNDETVKAIANCISVLQELTAKLQQAQEPEKTEEPWTPPEGEWFITSTGNVLRCVSDSETSNYGSEYKTKEEAQEQAELTKGWQWLCHLARELNPSGRCMKPSEDGYAIRVDYLGEGLLYSKKYQGVFETREAAEAAIKIMNRDFDRWKEIVG